MQLRLVYDAGVVRGRGGEQKVGEPVAADGAGAEPAPQQPAVTRLRWLLSQGITDPAVIAQLFASSDRGSQHGLLTELHQGLGNSYVQKLLAQLRLGGERPGVQRKSDGTSESTSEPGEVASLGVEAAADPLPYQAQIQASFGRHDVSNIRTRTGGGAAAASAALGASAYAVGDRVGFASAPDLHTAAHEAAHTVQQRAGVSLKGGIDGGREDAYERHADRVADSVVRGESAETLLDEMSPSSVSDARSGTTVQRKQVTATPDGMVNARRYLSFNPDRARTAIRSHIVAQGLPQPHPRMRWRDPKTFCEHLFAAFSPFDSDFERPDDFVLALFPTNPWHLIDSMRPLVKGYSEEGTKEKHSMYGGVVGPWDWLPSVGKALAAAFEQALIRSLYRLGPRWLEVAEVGGPATGSVEVDPSLVRRGHPMDRYVLPAMCAPGVFDLDAGSPAAIGRPSTAKLGIQPVELEWLGAGPSGRKELWNWVRAKPSTATAEDVAANLFAYMGGRDNEQQTEYYAAFLTQAPPLFGIPPHWAKTFEETRAFRPAPDKIPAADTDPDHQITVLAASTASDEQALLESQPGTSKRARAQAPEASADKDELVADVLTQANYLRGKLEPWRMGETADAAIAFAERRKQPTNSDNEWIPVLTAQRENLSVVSSGIRQLDSAIEQMGLKSKTGDEARPLREIMRFYGDAVAASHLKETSKRLVMRAATAQSGLALQAMQSSIRDMDGAADMMRASVAENDWDRNKANSRVDGLDADGLELQSRMMRGDGVTADEVERYQVNVEEAALDSKMLAIEVALRELASSASEAGDGITAWFASLPSSKFRSLPSATAAIREKLEEIRRNWQVARDAFHDDQVVMSEETYTLLNRRSAVQDAKVAFANVSRDSDIANFLKAGADTVKWQQFRTACVRVAALIGISMVGGFIGGAVARGASSMMMSTGGAAAVEGLGAGGSLIARGLGMAADAGVTSVGQTALFGGQFDENFLENMLQNLGTAGVMKVIGSTAAEALRVEKAVGGMWSKAARGGKVVLAESVALSSHMLMGAAMGYVTHKVVTGKSQPSPQDLQEWLLQGASIAVGRYVSKGIAAHAEARRRLTTAQIDGAAKLAAEANALDAMAMNAEHNPKASDAMELLAKRQSLLEQELKLLEDLESSPAKMKKAGMSTKEIAQARSEVHAQLRESRTEGLSEVALHTSGMQELIPGAVWSGTPDQIGELVVRAKDAGISVSAKRDAQGGKWNIELEGRQITVEERLPRVTGELPQSTGGIVSKANGEGPARSIQNAPGTNERAKTRLASLGEAERALVEGTLSRAQNSGQQVLLERAFAAGRTPSEIEQLRLEMRGMSGDEANLTFTGEGVVQFYQQSCVPASYQIAIAEVDPVYAMMLRADPRMVMQEQRTWLVERGSAQTKRDDVRRGVAPAGVRSYLDNPVMGKALHDDARYSGEGNNRGIETTEMVDSTLHEQLQKATGETYEVITDGGASYSKPGQGQYRTGSPPHEAIAAAVAAGRPVIVATRMGGTSHAQVIVGATTSATGARVYKVIDPITGRQADYPESFLDLFGAHSVTLPKQFADISKVPAQRHQPSSAPTHSSGPVDTSKAGEFLANLRSSSPDAADALLALGFTPELLTGLPHTVAFLQTGNTKTKTHSLDLFVSKTGLSFDVATRHLDEYLQFHPTSNVAELNRVSKAIGELLKGSIRFSREKAISAATALSKHPRYDADRSLAFSDIKGLLGDNVSPEVAVAEMLRGHIDAKGVVDSVVTAEVARAGNPGPDIKMVTKTGVSVGREMQTVGYGLKTAKDSTIDTAREQLENALTKAIKNKAIDYMRAEYKNYDSQEIVVQVSPSMHGYNFDAIVSEAGLVQRVIDRAWSSDDYQKAVTAAKQREAAGGPQPTVKKPDRIAVYDSTGKLVF